MDFELEPVTEPGWEMVRLAEMHAADFFTRSSEHDNNRTFVHENMSSIRQSGFLASAVPTEYGGLGVISAHDCMVAMNRLGRGDGSTSLAFNMHLFRTLSSVRGLKQALINNDKRRQIRLEELLKNVGAGKAIIAVANSEPGSDIRTSSSIAKKVEGGWILNGTKTFATGSPSADYLAVRAQYENDRGEKRMGSAIVPVDRKGIEILDNWDGMGMRGSGSHDVVFSDYFISDNEFDDIGEYGKFNIGFLATSGGTTLGLSSIFLGIAEKAHATVVGTIISRDRHRHALMQSLAAENEIDMSASRAILSRTAVACDDFYQAANSPAPTDSSPRPTPFQAVKNMACAKKFVMEKSCDIVNRCITMSGGSGFLGSNVLSRLYRDVRAGPLMQPFASMQAIEFIGQVSFGVDPNE
jgi:alkylation response protein AidB-like acyl-CoA dehydrogenase